MEMASKDLKYVYRSDVDELTPRFVLTRAGAPHSPTFLWLYPQELRRSFSLRLNAQGTGGTRLLESDQSRMGSACSLLSNLYGRSMIIVLVCTEVQPISIHRALVRGGALPQQSLAQIGKLA